MTASNLAGGTDATSGNTVSVPAANPTLSNQATAAATIGSAISDAATLAGSFNPTGTITFTAYGPTDSTCANPPAFTSPPVTVSGSGASAQFTPATTGTYRWTASYSGDTNNVAATSACNDANSSSVVNPRPPDPPAAAADDPRCERLRAKLTRQKRNLGREHNSAEARAALPQRSADPGEDCGRSAARSRRRRAAQPPVNFAGRFSTKASTPSMKSAVLPCSRWASASASSWPARSP